MINILNIYPQVKGIQVMNDMGDYMFSSFNKKWIPDTPARRKAILNRLATWAPFSNSSPVEGIQKAIRQFYTSKNKISLYVFGDDFTGGSIGQVLKATDKINKIEEQIGWFVFILSVFRFISKLKEVICKPPHVFLR